MRRHAPPLLLRRLVVALALLLSSCTIVGFTRLNDCGLQGQIASEFETDPARASALCGYAVQGMSLYYVHEQEERERSGVDIEGYANILGGPHGATAIVAGRPRPSPGVPSGTWCSGKVDFTYQGGSTCSLHTAARIVDRSFSGPPTIPLRSRVSAARPGGAAQLAHLAAGTQDEGLVSGDIVIPVSVEPAQRYRPRELRGRDWKGWDVTYELTVAEGVPLKANVLCESRINSSVELTVKFTRGDKDVGTLRRDVELQFSDRGMGISAVKTGTGQVVGWLLSTPGVYQARLSSNGTCASYLFELEAQVKDPP